MDLPILHGSKFKFKILGSENYIGIAIEQSSLNISIPITNYFFWPRNDAWEQIRLDISSKPWISTAEQFNILNGTAQILNDWNKSDDKKKFLKTSNFQHLNVEFVGIE